MTCTTDPKKGSRYIAKLSNENLANFRKFSHFLSDTAGILQIAVDLMMNVSTLDDDRMDHTNVSRDTTEEGKLGAPTILEGTNVSNCAQSDSPIKLNNLECAFQYVLMISMEAMEDKSGAPTILESNCFELFPNLIL